MSTSHTYGFNSLRKVKKKWLHYKNPTYQVAYFRHFGVPEYIRALF